MTLETELLQKAQAAGAQLQESERQALLARAEYHTAIRRLHLAGGSLREIARALDLSHQRVQQIVSEAGGSWWQRLWRTRKLAPDATCTFCGRPPSEVKKLVAGPDVYICDGCVDAAGRALDGRRSRLDKRRGACSFCGKKSQLGAAANAAVCGECLRLCREIIG
jgi:hypothetical protein